MMDRPVQSPHDISHDKIEERKNIWNRALPRSTNWRRRR